MATRRYRPVEEAGESSYSPLTSATSELSLEAEFSPQTASAPPKPPNNNAQRTAVGLFSVTTILLFADQNLMSPNLTAIADDFGFDEDERDRKLGGDISLAFFLLGAPASFIIGCLADTADRSLVFAWTVLIGEGACFLTYWTKTYEALYVCRAITGFSVGGAVPLIYSILGDLFAAEDRHAVSAVVSFGVGAGISVGQGIAGYIGPTFGWRLPFLLVSVPAMLLGLAVLWFVEDPPRGQMEEAVLKTNEEDGIALVSIPSESSIAFQKAPDEERLVARKDGGSSEVVANNNSARGGAFRSFDCMLHVRTLRNLLSTPTMILAVIQGAPGCVPWGILNVYLNDYLSEDRGFSIEMATTVLMCFGVGNALGLIFGGSCGSRLYKIDKRYPALLAGSMAILGCAPFWLLINVVDSNTSFWVVILIAVSAGFGSGPTGAIIKATVTNVSLPRSRGQAFALFALTDDFGKGLGPYFVSILIVHMGGRLAAFNIGILGWVICGLANLAVFFTVRQDEAKIQAAVASELESLSPPDSTQML
jgi:MFS family permease